VKSKSRFFSTKQPTFHIATMPTTPSGEKLLIVLKALRIDYPTLSAAKTLEKLRAENDWKLTEKRLKT
jgi:hypothetical protein